MDKIFIRKASITDIKSINELNFEMHNHLAKLLGLKFLKEELKSEEVNEKELKKENFYVAVIENKVRGFVAFSKKLEDEWYGKYVYLYEIAITRTFQRKGIGKKLFEVVLNYANKKRLNIKIDTNVKNKKIITFYKKLGFKPLSTDFILDLNKRLKI
jgi:ribosomal protein S18 acetylase RimI-like enzyme